MESSYIRNTYIVHTYIQYIHTCMYFHTYILTYIHKYIHTYIHIKPVPLMDPHPLKYAYLFSQERSCPWRTVEMCSHWIITLGIWTRWSPLVPSLLSHTHFNHLFYLLAYGLSIKMIFTYLAIYSQECLHTYIYKLITIPPIYPHTCIYNTNTKYVTYIHT